jgi:DNA ligase 1
MSESALLLGEQVLVKGSAKDPYILQGHNLGEDGQHFTCSCPAWRNQGGTVDMRTCKHLTKELGAEFESERIGKAVLAAPAPGAPSKAPPVILAESWDGITDPTGMLVSEKLDGVRAYWDGTKFLSRQGNVFYAPASFTAGLPNMVLDGELWIGRGKFQRTVSIVRTGTGDRGWTDIRYVVFDAPEIDAGFEERIEFLSAQKDSWNCASVDILEHAVCSGLDDVQARLDVVEAAGGEGLMLRASGSRYTSGRTSDLLKVKRFKDAEARVVGLEDGKGRHKGRAGALVCELANGTAFKIGTGLSDADREHPPAIGAIVTFRYQELTDAGVPRFPAFLRVRTDITDLSDAPEFARPSEQLAARSTSGSASSSAPKPAATKASTKAPAPAPLTSVAGDYARYEFVEGSSAKFWEVAVDGTSVTTRWGRIGTAGQSSTKSYATDTAASTAAEKLVGEKTDKGYTPA